MRTVLTIGAGLLVVSTAWGQAPPSECIAYVDVAAAGGDGTSWANAYTHLQDGLEAIETCSTTWVLVARGTYMTDGGRLPFGGDPEEDLVPGSGSRSAD